VVYYSDHAQPVEFRGYDLIVFDSDHHPDLGSLSRGGTAVLGYLGLCEVDESRSWFGAVRDAGLLLGDQPNWPGSHLIDIRDERWRQMVVKQLTHRILAQGFAGLFLDTLDDASELERRDPRKFGGFRNAAVRLVAEIHREVPSAVLMVNRGYDLLPDLLPYVNIALGESVYGTYDFSTKSYRPVETAIYRLQVELLSNLKKRKPALRICTLDYWDPADREGMRRVFREERAHGFDPYVTTIALDQLTKEPR
jgi:uncharacterized protein (TIGR01370 family)